MDADLLRHRKVMENKPTGAAAPSALTPEGTDYAATQYRVTGVMPSLGMGNAAARAAIINRAAEQTKEMGQSPAMAIQRQAARKADTASLTQLTKMQGSAESFENKALQQAGLIRDLSKKVSRTQFPIINEALLSGKKKVAGDTDTQLLYNAILTYNSEYAKIIEGSTGSVAAAGEYSQKKADSLMSAAFNNNTVEKSLDQMAREMQFTMDGYAASIDHITTRMGGAPPPSATPSQTGKPTAAELIKKYGGD
jgi:hypothetical protein